MSANDIELELQTEPSEVPLTEDCYGDITPELKLLDRRMTKSECDEKDSEPFLSTPIPLIRRYSYYEFNGDCYFQEASELEPVIVSRSNSPEGRKLVLVPAPTSKFRLLNSKWKGRLFRHLKRATEKQKRDESPEVAHISFKPRTNIFYLF
ncbi:unnamed protein product [Rodentolepis nana]|uniref:Uncharacterized protein n=1 Tax=Rodentolepis nana TaxID=102285 RepID=A0A0R3TQE2_RODNA|nr:unnamed protein product [Rodentolepis nana]